MSSQTVELKGSQRAVASSAAAGTTMGDGAGVCARASAMSNTCGEDQNADLMQATNGGQKFIETGCGGGGLMKMTVAHQRGERTPPHKASLR